MNIDWMGSVHSVSINYIASDCMGTQQTTKIIPLNYQVHVLIVIKFNHNAKLIVLIMAKKAILSLLWGSCLIENDLFQNLILS